MLPLSPSLRTEYLLDMIVDIEFDIETINYFFNHCNLKNNAIHMCDKMTKMFDTENEDLPYAVAAFNEITSDHAGVRYMRRIIFDILTIVNTDIRDAINNNDGDKVNQLCRGILNKYDVNDVRELLHNGKLSIDSTTDELTVTV